MKKFTTILLAATFSSSIYAQSDSAFNKAMKVVTGMDLKDYKEYQRQQQQQQQINTTVAPVTYDEYKYISRGLLDDANKGKDYKQGYRFELVELPPVEITGIFANTGYKFLKCYRNNETKPFCVAVKIYTNNTINKFLCVPTANAQQGIIDMAKKEFQLSFTTSVAAQLLFASVQLLGTTIN